MKVVTIVDSIAHIMLSSCKNEIRAKLKEKKKKMINDEGHKERGSYIKSDGTV